MKSLCRTWRGCLRVAGLALVIAGVAALSAAGHAGAGRSDTPAQLLADRSLDLAFVRGRFPRGSEIWLRDSGSKRERLLLRVDGRILDFRWVAGGQELLLRVDREPDYRRLRPDGVVEPVDDSSIQCDSSPLPARDGTTLGCSETAIDVIRNGQSENLVTEEDNVFIDDVALSPNGKRVAYADFADVEPAPYALNVLNFADGHPPGFSTTAPTELLRKRDISWSSDSRRVAYGLLRPGNLSGFVDQLPRWLRTLREAVVVLNPRGRPTARLAGAMRPDWSPRGRIAFDRENGGHREVFTVEPNGTRLLRLTGGPRNSWRPRWRR